MSKLCYFKGKIGDIDSFQLPLNDLAVLRGYGIFDYLRTYNGKPFLLDNHIDRFFYSADLLGLNVKEDRIKIKQVVASLLKKSGLKDAGFRLVLTGGASPDAFSFSDPHFFILIEPLPSYDELIWENGVKLMSHNYLRCLPEVKSINYVEAIRLQPQRLKAKAFDILYTYNANVLECTRSNFFLFHGDTLVTPQNNVLIGRTRNLILELADNLFKIEERDISIEELESCSEVFLSGTTKKVLPVRCIDELSIADGNRGVNTLSLQKRFNKYVASL